MTRPPPHKGDMTRPPPTGFPVPVTRKWFRVRGSGIRVQGSDSGYMAQHSGDQFCRDLQA